MRLIWLDAETTGLDPFKNSILEVAVGFADLSAPFELKTMDRFVLRFDDAHTYGAGCQQPGGVVVGLGIDDGPCPACSFYPEARAMHEKSGLLAECRTSTTTMGKVEDYLLTLVHGEPERGDDKPTLAGSTCHFDRGFLRVHAPRFAARLSHRHYDVSAVKLFCESLGMPRIPKALAHCATADIMESIQHARQCVDWLRCHDFSHVLEQKNGSSVSTDPAPPVWAVAFPSKTGPRHYLIDVDRVGWHWCTLCGRTHHPSLHLSASAKNYAGTQECPHADVLIPEAGAWCLVCGTAFLPGPTPARDVTPCAEPSSGDSARVHILYEGRALCGLSSEIPAKWPPGHRWVSYEEKDALDLSNCDACKANFHNFNVGQRREPQPGDVRAYSAATGRMEWTPAPSHVLPGEEYKGPQGLASPDAERTHQPKG